MERALRGGDVVDDCYGAEPEQLLAALGGRGDRRDLGAGVGRELGEVVAHSAGGPGEQDPPAGDIPDGRLTENASTFTSASPGWGVGMLTSVKATAGSRWPVAIRAFTRLPPGRAGVVTGLRS